jgi:hypothetical protein
MEEKMNEGKEGKDMLEIRQNIAKNVNCKVHRAVNFKVKIFGNVVTCSLGDRYKHCGDALCCICRVEDTRIYAAGFF